MCVNKNQFFFQFEKIGTTIVNVGKKSNLQFPPGDRSNGKLALIMKKFTAELSLSWHTYHWFDCRMDTDELVFLFKSL